MERKFYIDRLRIFLTVLVIFHHTIIAYGASGGWYYISPETLNGWQKTLVDALTCVNQSYFMSFFFLISAFFMPASYDKKGFSRFLSDRFVRLGIPLLVYTFIINPILVYAIYHDGFQSFWDCFSCWGVGPLWFVWTLLFFEVAYALYRRFCKVRISNYFSDTLSGYWEILSFILLTGLVAFAFRLVYPTGSDFYGLQFGYFSLYIFMYLVGIIANRKGWFDKMTIASATPWGILAACAFGVMLWVMLNDVDGGFSGGWNANALFYAMWEPWMCVGICYFLLAWCAKYANAPSWCVARCSADSFAAYIFHAVFVVGCTFWVQTWPLTPFSRMIITILLASVLSFGFARLVRAVPGVKHVL